MSSVDAALRRQLGRLADALAEGMPRVGWKICLNDARMQRHLGLDGPFVGWLDGRCVVQGGGAYALPAGARLAVEPEIAVRVGTTLSPAPTLAEAAAAVVSLAPAIEVVDWSNLVASLDRVVEASSFHHGVVLGEPRPPQVVARADEASRGLFRGEACVAAPVAALAPPDPAVLVGFVARFLGRYGEGLRAGDWILSGACTPTVPVAAGDLVTADFGPLGEARVRFVAQDPPSSQ